MKRAIKVFNIMKDKRARKIGRISTYKNGKVIKEMMAMDYVSKSGKIKNIAIDNADVEMFLEKVSNDKTIRRLKVKMFGTMHSTEDTYNNVIEYETDGGAFEYV